MTAPARIALPDWPRLMKRATAAAQLHGAPMTPAQSWTAFAAGLAVSPIATTIACLVLRQWIKALIAGGVVAGMVVSAVEVWL